MREERAGEVGGVMHCFTETWDVAQRALDLGFHISFSGIVTFKNAVELKDVARRVPLDRMLIETDSPYLAPVPYRGKRNQPAWVRYVGEEIARLRGLPVAEVAAATSANFFRPLQHRARMTMTFALPDTLRAAAARCLVALTLLAVGPAPALADAYEDFVFAVSNDRVPQVKELLAKGIDPNTVAPNGEPVLVIAARVGFAAHRRRAARGQGQRECEEHGRRHRRSWWRRWAATSIS